MNIRNTIQSTAAMTQMLSLVTPSLSREQLAKCQEEHKKAEVQTKMNYKQNKQGWMKQFDQQPAHEIDHKRSLKNIHQPDKCHGRHHHRHQP